MNSVRIRSERERWAAAATRRPRGQPAAAASPPVAGRSVSAVPREYKIVLLSALVGGTGRRVESRVAPAAEQSQETDSQARNISFSCSLQGR